VRLPKGNQGPVVTSIVVVAVALLLLAAGGAALGLDPYAAGGMGARVVMAGVVLAAWGSQAGTPWSRGGYLWRFGVALVVVIMLALLCGVPFGRPPA
jgi:hypothetical protein